MEVRKLFTWLVILALALPLVASCAPAAEPTPTPTKVPAATPTKKPPPTATPVPEPCAPATSGPLAGVDPRGQTVVWWHNHSRHREEWLTEVSAEFNATNECGITLVPENQGGYNDIRDKMNAGIATGELPGLVVGYQNDQAFYALATKNWSVGDLKAVAPDEQGPFIDHLHVFSWGLSQKPECKKALKQITRQGRCDDEVLFLKLQAAGLIQGEDRMHANWRCRLYADYFKRHL